MILIILMYALCASSFTISKAVLLYAQPVFFVAVRMMLAGTLLLGYEAAKKQLVKIRRGDVIDFLFIVLFHIYCAYIFDVWSLQFMPSFKSAFFFNLSPFITAVLAYMFLHERINKGQLVGMLIGFIGMLPMLVQQNFDEKMAGEFFRISIPEIMLLFAVVSSCIGWIFFKRLVHKGYNPIFVNGFGMWIGGFLALVTSFITEHSLTISPVTEWGPFWQLTILIILICNITFYTLYGVLLRTYSVTFLSLAGFLCPLFAGIFGIIFLREHVTWHFVIALIMVSAGLWIFDMHQRKGK